LQGKEYSRKAPTIRIRVNLQGMDLSRKSGSGIRKEQYLQGKQFARNRISKEGAAVQRLPKAVVNGFWQSLYTPLMITIKKA